MNLGNEITELKKKIEQLEKELKETRVLFAEILKTCYEARKRNTETIDISTELYLN